MQFNKINLFPYFQPIISIDNSLIYGYEILGRFLDVNNKVKSLGSFFTDSFITNDKVLEVDKIIQEKGIKEFSLLARKNEKIFVNMRLDWLAEYANNPQDMPTILWADKYGVDYKNIIIEITEEDVNASTNVYMTALSYYRNIGCKIAIDDYGCKNSNIYRLAELNPDIIKIDMSFIQKSEELYQYRHYLKILTEFASNMGIEVLYEGIENSKQLLNCINSQGRFYQGFFLSKPLSTIEEAIFDKEAFRYCCQLAIITNQTVIGKNKSLQQKMDKLIDNYFKDKPFEQSDLTIDEYIVGLCGIIPLYTIRMYVCNKYGFQISSNIECGDCINLSVDLYGRNCAWSGVFINALKVINDNQFSFLTEVYRDVLLKEKIYTYVRILDINNYLFIDISKSEMEKY
ncbi:MAG: EAL domain-containing protein [Pleomorphochaeta sp.]